jgi:protein-S-isoprenylcysteine O-methyltransferase Ste14
MARHAAGKMIGTAILLGSFVAPFAAAGTIRWLDGWLYLGMVLVGAVAEHKHVAKKNPALIRRRNRIGKGTPAWDKIWNAVFWLLVIATPAAAGLDVVRLGHLPMTPWLWPAGAGVITAGFVLSAWAMGENPHFEGTVRIQRDVGHRVVDTGPYRFIRHPGYAALVLIAAGSPILLASRWAAATAALVVIWIALRTVLEDVFLRRELDGYAAYARRVRFRLVPFLF